MNASLKESLINTSAEAFLSLSQQINHLLDTIEFYFERYQQSADADDDSLSMKRYQLLMMVETLGSLPYQLADVIHRWKNGQPRVLSQLGVELTLINEIWATLQVTLVFFVKEGIDPYPYNHEKAEKAYIDLARCNRCLS